MKSILYSFKFILWVSPVVKLIVDTLDAISDGYNEKYLTDPGHKAIKRFDTLVILITWSTLILVGVPSFIHYLNTYSEEYVIVLLILFFPYFFNFYISVLLYTNSLILFIYNKNRKNIIRKINEKKGAW